MMLDLDDAAIAEMKETGGFWYLGSEYTLFDGGIEMAARLACRAAGFLMSKGIAIFSPIAHSHPIAAVAGLNPLDHALWMSIDRPIMEAAEGLIVVRSPGWKLSRGLAEEIAFFRDNGAPVYGYDPA
jgi:hypothetical protein